MGARYFFLVTNAFALSPSSSTLSLALVRERIHVNSPIPTPYSLG